MRTTIDIDDNLYRKAKSTSALRGMKLKQFFQTAIQHELERNSQTDYAPDRKTAFPLVAHPPNTPKIELSEKRLADILDAEDIDALA